MHAHNFLINQCDKWHIIEAIIKLLPKFNVISSFDFIEESIQSCDCLTFMITPQDDNLVWVSDLKCEKKTDYLATLLASINIVAHKEITIVLRDNKIPLILLILITHLFEHMN